MLALLGLASPMMAQSGAHGGPTGHEDGGGHGVMEMAVARDAGLSVRERPDDHEIVLRLGPVSLPATGTTMKITPARELALPVEGWLTSFQARVVGEDGRTLTPRLLHHFNVVVPGRRELFFPAMQRLVAAGQETGEIGLPWPFGVPVSVGETLLVAAMVQNTTGRPVRFFIEATLHYDTPSWLPRIAVQPFYMDVRLPPEDAAFDLAPGRTVRTWEGSPAVDVTVLGLGAHMHRYAREVRLEEVHPDGTSDVLWRARPVQGEDGRIAGVPRQTFLLRLGLRLRADRRYRLVGVYENPTGRTIRDGAMAEIGGVAIAGDDWPRADYSAPRLLADFRNFTRFAPALRERAGAESRP